MHDGARLKMAASIGKAGDLAPRFRDGIEAVTGFHVDLRAVVPVIAAQCIKLAIQHRRSHVAARVGQVGFPLPMCSSVERQAPMIAGGRVAIGLVAAEVMQFASDHCQAAAWRGSGKGGPAVQASAATSYFQTSATTGPGCFPLKPPANQMVFPSMAGSRCVSRVGMSFFGVQESLAGS